MTYLTGTGQVTHVVFASHFYQRDVAPLQGAVVKKESFSGRELLDTVRTMALLFSSHHFYPSAKSLVIPK